MVQIDVKNECEEWKKTKVEFGPEDVSVMAVLEGVGRVQDSRRGRKKIWWMRNGTDKKGMDGAIAEASDRYLLWSRSLVGCWSLCLLCTYLRTLWCSQAGAGCWPGSCFRLRDHYCWPTTFRVSTWLDASLSSLTPANRTALVLFLL